jgi:DNA-binding IclR family transcriptional regulator
VCDVITLSRLTTSLASELAVLRVLAPGGQLTLVQLARDARLGRWMTRKAIEYLDARGCVVPTYARDRWRITDTGRAWLTQAKEAQRGQ